MIIELMIKTFLVIERLKFNLSQEKEREREVFVLIRIYTDISDNVYN